MTKEINLKKKLDQLFIIRSAHIYTYFEYDKGQQKIFTKPKVHLSYV